MVRVKLVERDANENLLTLQQSAEQTAIAVHDEMLALVNSTDPRVQVDPDHVTVLLQNFGDSYWGGHTKFLHPSDAVDVDIDNDNDNDWPDTLQDPEFYCSPSNVLACDTDLLQPWMTQGRVKPAQWMQLFLAKLGDLCENDDSDAFPSRFDFDTDLFLTSLGNANLSFLLGRMVSDPRWDSVDVPGSGLTMKELWQELWVDGRANRDAAFEATKSTIYPDESSIYNPWTNTTGPAHLASSPHLPFEQRSNREIFLWVCPIFQRAIDALMNEAAYGPIRQFGLNNGNRTIICSNYGHQWTDGQPQRIDWAYDLAGPVPVPCMATPCNPFPRIWVDERIAGVQDSGQHGGITMPLSSGQWLVGGAGSAWARSSAPVLYLAGNANVITDGRVKIDALDYYYTDSYRQYDVYRKNRPASPPNPPMPPRDTHWHASLKQHERTLDAIIRASDAAGEYDFETATSTISPWLIMPRAGRLEGVDPGNESYPLELRVLSVEESVDQLWLMRRKRVPTLLLWDAAGYDPEQTEPSHSILAQPYVRVYRPYLSSQVTPEHGTILSADTSTARIEDSVPRKATATSSLEDYYLELESAGFACCDPTPQTFQNIASFVVRFNDLEQNKGLQLHFECSAKESEDLEGMPSGYPTVKIYIRNHQTDTYTLMPVDAVSRSAMSSPIDDYGVSGGPTMRFWAPTNPPVETRWKSMRRTIKWSPSQSFNLVSSTGFVDVKFVVATAAPFRVRVDVLQLMNTTDTAEGVGPESSMVSQGGDMDYDLVVSEQDVGVFLNQYLEQGVAADLNFDEVVDVHDMVRYAEFISQ